MQLFHYLSPPPSGQFRGSVNCVCFNEEDRPPFPPWSAEEHSRDTHIPVRLHEAKRTLPRRLNLGS